MINSQTIYKNKTVEAKIKLYVHLQRARVDENLAERSIDKWIAEGEVNGVKLKYLKRVLTLQGRKCVSIFVKVD